MLTALSSLAAEQCNPTERTMQKCKQFLDYAATQEDAVVTYRKSNMVLAIHSDASYLSESEPKARSRAGGHFFMSENLPDPNDNGAVHTVAKIINAVMSSAAEAELGGLFINAKTAVPIRTTLEELGHKQPLRQFKRTTRQELAAWQTTKFSPKPQKQWTCASTG
jgi:hypothetical protein